jgi:hypothetical protein
MPDYSYDLPANYYFGGGGVTVTTPLAIVFVVLASIFIFVLPRKYVLVPFMLAGLLMPAGFSVVVASLNFSVTRLLLIAGWARIIKRGERYPRRLNTLDKVILFGALVNAIAYSLLWREFGAIVNRAGFLFSALGTYFLLRSFIRSKEDILLVIKVFAIVVTLAAPLMWSEHLTQHNMFSLLGAPELSNLRMERVRAQGPFAHAIIAGTFGVVLIPLFVGLWWHRPGAKIFAAAGIASSTLMMFASSSSTPLMTFPAGILALSMYPLRKKMRMVRWGIVLMLIGLQLVMNAPIWQILTRISGVLGGSGWHRAMLIENFVYRFFDWWLIGTRDNQNWGWSMWDVDNAFVGAGIMGGLLGFILFVAIFVHGYKMVGVAEKTAEGSRSDERLIWAIGAALFANTVAFFGIVYFDQSIIAWYALLVMISVISTSVEESQRVKIESKTMLGENSLVVADEPVGANKYPATILKV